MIVVNSALLALCCCTRARGKKNLVKRSRQKFSCFVCGKREQNLEKGCPVLYQLSFWKRSMCESRGNELKSEPETGIANRVARLRQGPAHAGTA